MKIHELQLTSTKDKKRVGRGIGSGYGKTAGRGTKGQNARTGGGVRIGFAGGQNPLAKLLPKIRGFKSLNPTTFQVVSLTALDRYDAGTTVDAAMLANDGLVKYANRGIKVLAGGTISKKLILQVHAVSAAAKTAIEAAGGSVELLAKAKPAPKKATRPPEAATAE